MSSSATRTRASCCKPFRFLKTHSSSTLLIKHGATQPVSRGTFSVCRRSDHMASSDSLLGTQAWLCSAQPRLRAVPTLLARLRLQLAV
eukprot:3951576-Pleurochrysis_carterae.AAC.2